VSRNGGRKRAARTVRIPRFDPRPAQNMVRCAIKKNVYCMGTARVAAFQENGAAAELHQLLGISAHIGF
jgi:hypothetical protein